MYVYIYNAFLLLLLDTVKILFPPPISLLLFMCDLKWLKEYEIEIKFSIFFQKVTPNNR